MYYGFTDDERMPVKKLKPDQQDLSRFVSWGNNAQLAQQEGWEPISWDGNYTTFKGSYNGPMNTVVVPGEKDRGYIAAIGNNKNGLFDLVIKTNDGRTVKTLLSQVPSSDVRGYFTNKNSTIAQRAASIQAGTNLDKRQADGSYLALYR